MVIKYKWESPHDWLMEKAQTWNADELFQALQALAYRLDCDSVQDLFQEEMAQDGYFNAEKD